MTMAARPFVAEKTRTMVSALPWLARCLVANPAPQIDDLLTIAVDAAGSTELVAAGKVLFECVSYALEAFAHLTVDPVVVVEQLCRPIHRG